MKKISKPAPREYPSDLQQYMDLIPNDGNVLKYLWDNFIELKQFLINLPDKELEYKKEEWHSSAKETLMHMMDQERIYLYQILRYSRNDETPLRNYDQEEYAANSGANNRSIGNILEEYEALRKSTVLFLNNLTDECYTKGRSDLRNYGFRSIRAIIYYIAGYELDQYNGFKKILLNLQFDLSDSEKLREELSFD